MAQVRNHEVEIEYKLISDMYIRPQECPACGFNILIRHSYKFIDLQDIGTISIKRILRHELVLWECKKCGNQFTIKNTKLPFDTNYTNDVKQYVLKRVLEMGDSMRRVVSDLAILHNVTVRCSAGAAPGATEGFMVKHWVQAPERVTLDPMANGKQ